VVVHHMGHNGERSRGDSRIRDWPDAEWQLIREAEGNESTASRYFKAVGRDVAIEESLLAFDPSNRHLSIAGGSRKDGKAGSALTPILDLLKSAAGGLSGNQIEGMLAGIHSRNDVRAALKKAEAGGVTVVSRGPRGANIHKINAEFAGGGEVTARSSGEVTIDLATSPIGRGEVK